MNIRSQKVTTRRLAGALLLATAVSAGPLATAASAATTGSVGITITSPVAVSGSKTVPVTCTTGAVYKATVSSAVVKGDQVSVAVSVAGYRGPGSYPAVVTLTVKEASGTTLPIPKAVKTPAVLTSTGGSFSMSVTSTQGKRLTFAGSLHWTCGA